MLHKPLRSWLRRLAISWTSSATLTRRRCEGGAGRLQGEAMCEFIFAHALEGEDEGALLSPLACGVLAQLAFDSAAGDTALHEFFGALFGTLAACVSLGCAEVAWHMRADARDNGATLLRRWGNTAGACANLWGGGEGGLSTQSLARCVPMPASFTRSSCHSWLASRLV